MKRAEWLRYCLSVFLEPLAVAVSTQLPKVRALAQRLAEQVVAHKSLLETNSDGQVAVLEIIALARAAVVATAAKAPAVAAADDDSGDEGDGGVDKADARAAAHLDTTVEQEQEQEREQENEVVVTILKVQCRS